MVIPTVEGREEHYARCVTAYRENSVLELELITVRDAPWVGRAWKEGAEQATGEFLHLTADDLAPRPGWDAAAVQAATHGVYPAAFVYDFDGQRLDQRTVFNNALWEDAPAPMSTVPFMPTDMWSSIGPGLDCHYYTDDWLSLRATAAGLKVRTRTAFAFGHYWAESKRGAGMDPFARLAQDRAVYHAACVEHGYTPTQEV